jgi:siroheme synthase
VASVLAADTAAIYMGAGEAHAIATALLSAGKAAGTPIALIEDASLPATTVQFTTLAELPQLATRGGPTLILLGEVYGEALRALAELRERASHRL